MSAPYEPPFTAAAAAASDNTPLLDEIALTSVTTDPLTSVTTDPLTSVTTDPSTATTDYVRVETVEGRREIISTVGIVTVQGLRLRLAERFTVQPEHQRLIASGRELVDTDTVASINRTTIQLAVRRPVAPVAPVTAANAVPADAAAAGVQNMARALKHMAWLWCLFAMIDVGDCLMAKEVWPMPVLISLTLTSAALANGLFMSSFISSKYASFVSIMFAVIYVVVQFSIRIVLANMDEPPYSDLHLFFDVLSELLQLGHLVRIAKNNHSFSDQERTNWHTFYFNPL
jgi:hypothetical protein